MCINFMAPIPQLRTPATCKAYILFAALSSFQLENLGKVVLIMSRHIAVHHASITFTVCQDSLLYQLATHHTTIT